MADQDLLLQALRSFAATMGGSYDTTAVSYELCDRVVEALGATGAGVSVVDDDGDLKFVTATNDLIVHIEEAQETAQEGPCVSAFRSQQPVVIADIRSTDQWPGFRPAAESLGLAAMVGYPLTYDQQRLGALNVYNTGPSDWTDEDLDVIGVFADMATAYLVRTSELAEARQLAEQLQEALESRVVVEQAKGILAAEHGIGVDEAFELLRGHSRSNQVGLTELARAVVELGLRIPRQRQR